MAKVEKPKEKARAHVLISGKVQGVFYRSFAQTAAEWAGVKGFVRNKEDAKVEVVVEGTKAKVEKFIAELKKGPASAKIEKVEIKWKPFKNEFDRFEVRWGDSHYE